MSATALPTAFFAHACGDDVELVLRELSTTVEMHELVVANLERLRRWEQWALDHAFGSARLSRVEARIATADTRSRRLAEQLGFTLEGTLRSAHVVGPERSDLAVCGRLAEDREALRDRPASIAA